MLGQAQFQVTNAGVSTLLVSICGILAYSIMLYLRTFLKNIAISVRGIWLFFIYLLSGLNIFD